MRDKVLDLKLIGMRPFSKQHGGGRCGNRYFVKPGYISWKNTIATMAKIQAAHARWKIPDRKERLQLEIKAAGAGRMDTDNLAGGLMDALIGILYEDDHQVRRLISETCPMPKDKIPVINISLKIIN